MFVKSLFHQAHQPVNGNRHNHQRNSAKEYHSHILCMNSTVDHLAEPAAADKGAEYGNADGRHSRNANARENDRGMTRSGQSLRFTRSIVFSFQSS